MTCSKSKPLIKCDYKVLATVLNRYYNSTDPYSPIFLNWYIGELSTAVYVANIPLCWPLLRYCFKIGPFIDKHSIHTPPHHHPLDQISVGKPSSSGNEAIIRIGCITEVMVTSSKDWPLDNTIGPPDGKIMKTVHVTQSIV